MSRHSHTHAEGLVWSPRLIAACIAAAFCIAAAGFASGWVVKGYTTPAAYAPKSLRLGGYQFIDPLLLCNINSPSAAKEDKELAATVQEVITKHIKSGDISKASIYFADLSTGKWADVNPNATYYPSSLGKIPIMIAYYQLAENVPGTLEKRIVYPAGSEDRNLMQDIMPVEAIVPGNSYTIRELVDYMIKYSDNNATQLLYTNINHDLLNSVYADLNIPVNEDPDLSNLDFIKPHQISTLFRVLYNATYLTKQDSEAALKLLGQSSFTQGIVAGVASSTIVAHKLGLVGIAPGDIMVEHELHDCGIVYGKDTYHLCIMTRGAGSLEVLEGVVAEISRLVYRSAQGSVQ